MHAHLNPFRSACQEALRFDAPGATVPELLERLDLQGGRGSLVGPQGSGKTTLLLELAGALSDRGLDPTVVRLNATQRRPDWRALRNLTGQTPLLVDGAEQLSLLAWWRIRWRARRAPYLVTTSHRRAHLPLLHRHATSPALLRTLVGRLLADSPADGAVPHPSAVVLDALFARHAGDVRACLRELYDRYA